MHRILLFTALSFIAVFSTGCGTGPEQSVRPICTANAEVEAVMASAEEVLGQMHFTIDKADVQQGYIRTLPLTGAQLFEFWRKDNVGQFNTAEANLQTIRRTIEINVSSEYGHVCADCVVTVERMSLPQREAVSATHASAMFTRSSPSLQQLELNPEQQEGMTWIELGRDSRLEAEILRQLKMRL
jgi:hypothetical protein